MVDFSMLEKIGEYFGFKKRIFKKAKGVPYGNPLFYEDHRRSMPGGGCILHRKVLKA